VPRKLKAPQRRGQSKETLAQLQDARGKETSDDRRSDDVTSSGRTQAEIRCKPSRVYRSSMAGGNVWDSLADLLKIMNLREVGKDDEKEIQEIVHIYEYH